MCNISNLGIRMLAIFSFFMAASCSNATGNIGQKTAQSTLPREIRPQVTDADLAAVVAGNTEFALKVFPLLDTTPNNNTWHGGVPGGA